MTDVPNDVWKWRGLVESLILGTIRPATVLGIIWQESSGVPYSWNPEPRYKWLWDVKRNEPFRKQTELEIMSENPPGDFPHLAGDKDQEWWAQQASWGLMQTMGAVARERGFKGGWIPQFLYDPTLSIKYGILHLWVYCYREGKNSTVEALLRYNGGGDPKYPDKVLDKASIIDKKLVGAP